MSTPNPFAQPDKGERFAPRDHPEWVGRLFIIYPDSVSQHMGKSSTGQPEPYEAVEADVAIVDLINPETGQPKVLTGVRIGGKSLVPQIKKHCGGGMVLGRLTQGQSSAEKSGAYYLAEYTDADVQLATQYINTHPRNQFTQPTAQAAPAPAQQQAWGQPPQNVTQMPGYGGPQPQPQPQPQYASQQLPYDPWQGTPTAAAPQPQGAPAGPPQGQWGAPAASPQAAPAPTPPASPSAVDAATLAAFLTSKNVPTQGMTEDQVRMIASTYPDCPQPGQPPF